MLLIDPLAVFSNPTTVPRAPFVNESITFTLYVNIILAPFFNFRLNCRLDFGLNFRFEETQLMTGTDTGPQLIESIN